MKNLPLITNLALNQFVIIDDKGRTFKSYDTLICHIPEAGQKLIDPAWKISRTTIKYTCEFTGLNKAGIEAGIKSGLFILKDLNRGKKVEKQPLNYKAKN